MSKSVSETRSGFKTLTLVYSGMFAALMMIGANITAFVPFLVIGGVPITLQTFFAILSGALLGSRNGVIAMTVYMFVGLAGAPVFSRFSGGLGSLLSPNFGFVISFILVAYIVGKIVESKRTLKSYVVAALVGTVINYLIGTNWLYFSYKFWAAAPEAFTYKVAWLWMAVPFPKDFFLAILAGVFGYRMQGVLKRSHQ